MVETSKKDQVKSLKTGFSTGTAATAAALAATVALRSGQIPEKVEVTLPKGLRLTIPVLEGQSRPPGQAVVVKEAGDDPDVTNKAQVGALVEPQETALGLSVLGGEGVGLVTKPGLVLTPGEWAINPVPRRMLAENLAPFLSEVGLKVTIFIRDGAELAQRTLNPRLGIVGGLSVLGTSGLVKPFSHAAYVATIASALSVARAMALKEVVLTTGGRSEALAQTYRPDLPPEAFVQVADYFAVGLKKATALGFTTIGIADFFGKAVKQARGYACTHAHKNAMDLAALASWLPDLDPHLKEALALAPTALGALDLLKAAKASTAIKVVAQKVLVAAQGFTGQKPRLWVVIFDFNGTILAREGL
ncbi:MAG: cobalt-precorrin-5B (C(1))-methyltransferase CbiD [Deltaproteobacteria bacterium]|jgi:cobalt-precorrin-5B (C1)-methyltransferase|nr:cobalt-precorrin-5B (C(1))-methyltransferase CbiD [Deltaproteobacteria bacterium]